MLVIGTTDGVDALELDEVELDLEEIKSGEIEGELWGVGGWLCSILTHRAREITCLGIPRKVEISRAYKNPKEYWKHNID
jgi:hypothetical protein